MVKVKKVKSKKRAMERQMRRMGVDFQQLEAVTEVLIRFPDRELVLTEPQVVTMQGQGDNVYQIIGQAEERSLTVSSEAEEGVPKAVAITFSEEDVQLVANQANVSEEEAREALRAAEGNLARAIIALTES
ncbi:MAG: nascent polypeptide-associated complex protein [Candidatus Hermodarchaeia archaeon]